MITTTGMPPETRAARGESAMTNTDDAGAQAAEASDETSHDETPGGGPTTALALVDENSEIARFAGAPFNAKLGRRTLMGGLLRARRWYGGSRVCIVDADDKTLTYNQLIRAAFELGHALKPGTRKGEAVGVLLPTSAAAAAAFYALSAYGRVPAMLNFTAGARALGAACKAVQARRIITARTFIEKAGLQDLAATLAQDYELIFLEDVRAKLSAMDKLAGLASGVAAWALRAHVSPDSPGVYLFTSGTEGAPKGVALSHANIIANAEQAKQHIPQLYPSDVAINPLPTFHCFGLTGGLVLPLMAGFTTVLHPTPLQAKTIVERVREHRASILFATDTFLSQYARAANDNDLTSLRFAVCGAERVKDETRALLRRRFGLEVLEGYGATEAAPVIAVNQPTLNKPGTVGRLLPGMEAKLTAVPGMPGAGRLHVRGPNVMAGYVNASDPGVVEPLERGWHDTGDIVAVDDDGCITIRGRLKRFAKLGGEMISLAIVENCATSLWPDNLHAAVAAPGARKGEEILLVSDCPEAARDELVAFARNHGVSELAVPARVIHVDAVPILGTGKIDYVAVERLVSEARAGASK
jgi:acyl-[acyl-carrier-protein]-phospholipid O-acyltransferase/long-chain-fatty-acid--[acyl-carrier-protein] ligase